MAIGTVVYMAGIFGQTFCAPSLEGLYASRFVAGLGIGVTTVLPSVYISEVRRSVSWVAIWRRYGMLTSVGFIDRTQINLRPLYFAIRSVPTAWRCLRIVLQLRRHQAP